jgi:hypothetical protein
MPLPKAFRRRQEGMLIHSMPILTLYSRSAFLANANAYRPGRRGKRFASAIVTERIENAGWRPPGRKVHQLRYPTLRHVGQHGGCQKLPDSPMRMPSASVAPPPDCILRPHRGGSGARHQRPSAPSVRRRRRPTWQARNHGVSEIWQCPETRRNAHPTGAGTWRWS